MIALAGWYDTINWQGHRTWRPRLVNDNAALEWTAGITGLLPVSGPAAFGEDSRLASVGSGFRAKTAHDPIADAVR